MKKIEDYKAGDHVTILSEQTYFDKGIVSQVDLKDNTLLVELPDTSDIWLHWDEIDL